jgi:hypothetical protein
LFKSPLSLFLAANSVLVLLEGLIPQTRTFLPLGGSELTQLGATFVLYLLYISMCGGPPPI